MATANEELLDRVIRRAVYLEGWKNRLSLDVRAFLAEGVYPDLMGRLTRQLERIADRGPRVSRRATARLVELEREMREILGAGMLDLHGDVVRQLKEFASDEVAWMQQRIERALPLQLQVTVPPRATLSALVEREFVRGAVLRDHFSTLGRVQARQITQAVRIGIGQGESLDQIVRRIRGTRAGRFRDGVLEATTRHAETWARTAANHVSARAREETFRENDELVKGVRWVSTLDTRTSLICMDLDGDVFPLDSGQRPPAHPNCRSSVVPILKSWRELGINLNEAPEGTRASMDGQVPEKQTYGEWLKGQPAEVQNEALGRERAKLFREGKIQIGQFVNRQGHTRTLDELRSLDS